MRTNRVPVSQAMTASVAEKRKKPEGKVTKEPLVIPCTVEELNHVLDKWIGDGFVRPFTRIQATYRGRKKESLVL